MNISGSGKTESTTNYEVTKTVHDQDGRTYVELQMKDAWVWDMYRTTRFVSSVNIVTFKDVNIEELPSKEL